MSSQPATKRRRVPKQERSRGRVEAITEAARDLIGRRGNDAVSMREIAAKANVPIASIYQYFADKNAILRTLMQGYLQRMMGELAELLDAVQSPDDLPDALGAMVDVMVRAFKEQREFPTIWAAVQANTALRELEAEDGRRIGEFLAARFSAIAPEADPVSIRAACLHAVHTVGTTVRVALLYYPPEDAQLLIDEFKTLIRLRLESIVPSLHR